MNPVLLAALLAAAPLPLLAHAVLEPAEAPPGARYEGAIRIGHGCDGQPTREIRLTLPAGLSAAEALPMPGWTVAPGAPGELVWTGLLPPKETARFAFAAQVDAAAGAVLVLPVVQICDTARILWDAPPEAGTSDRPAPVLHVGAAPAPGASPDHAGMDHSAHAAHAADDTAPAGAGAVATLGSLRLEDATSRATPPGAKVGAGYLTIVNSGPDDRLVSVRSPVAAEVQIHEMAMAGDVMQMRERPDGVPLPAGETVRLQAGGLHLMLLSLRQPLAAGDVVPLTLTFEKAGEVALTLPVLPLGTRGEP